MIDKLLRAAADSVGVGHLVLGARFGDRYEIVATHGVPIANFVESLPADRLPPRLFARPVEVYDLQAEPEFFVLGMTPSARNWRYGANVPVKLYHPVTDDGVFALSVADPQTRPLGGPALSLLTQYADFLSDCIWLVTQIHLATDAASAMETMTALLLDGVRNSPPPIALVDADLRVLGCSPGFEKAQAVHFGAIPAVGSRLGDTWLRADALGAVHESLKTSLPVMRHQTAILPQGDALFFDFHNIRYGRVGARFGLFVLHLPFSAVETPGHRVMDKSAGHHKRARVDEAGPLVTFLRETLGHRPRLRVRAGRSYVAVRAWRTPIKPYQLSALKALKRDYSSGFVDAVAGEIADAIRAIHGNVDHCVVVPMPCGHSGEGCFSAAIGTRVAELLDIERIDAFDPIAVPPGASHPKSNLRRPRMNLRQTTDRTVLLIDDVAASGAHVGEAASLLAKAALAVLPVVWVAD